MPFVGAFVSAVPPVLLVLLSDPILALWVALAYTAIQQVESQVMSQVIQPVVISRAVALHPAVLLFGLLLMGSLFGLVGLLLTVPLVATVRVLVRELWVRRMDGAPARTQTRPPEAAAKAPSDGCKRSCETLAAGCAREEAALERRAAYHPGPKPRAAISRGDDTFTTFLKSQGHRSRQGERFL